MKMVNKIFRFCKKYQTLLLLPVTVIIGFAFRCNIMLRDTAKLEEAAGAKFAPYLVESAVMYGYINKVADGESIAGIDPALPAMKNVKAAEQMSLSLEYAGGWLLKLYRFFHGVPTNGEYEKSYAETAFLRKAFCFYIALSFGFIFLALRFLKVPALIALLATAIEIFSAAALGRYTGQDLIKGAFALPLLTACIAAAAAAVHGTSRQRKTALLFAFFTAFAAVASWDASQMIIGLLAICEIIRNIFTNTPSTKRRDLWLTTFLALTIAALFIPYNRMHGAFFSPVLQFLLPGAIAVNFIPAAAKRYWRILSVIALAIWSWVVTIISPFAGNYSHFAELLQAKLKYGNILPADPAVLNFNIRYLWTPELHSATWKMTRMLFPGVIVCFIMLWIIYLIRNIILRKTNRLTLAEKVWSWELTNSVSMTIIAAAMYVYMARFRDIAVLFAVFAIALFSAVVIRRSRSKVWHCIIVLILAGTAAVEWHNSRHLKRGYPQGLPQTAELVKYLRKYDLAGKLFLSDMQTSTLLKGYTDASILIQAKYELPEVRNLTEEFIMTFFNEKTVKFAQFCKKHNVDYLLIHVPTITTSWKIPYSYCYVSNTKRLKKDSAAGQLGIGKGGRNFYELPLPKTVKNIGGYRLYKFLSDEDLRRSKDLTIAAWEACYLGQYKKARHLIRQAYSLNPGINECYKAYVKICRTLPPEITLRKKSQNK